MFVPRGRFHFAQGLGAERRHPTDLRPDEATGKGQTKTVAERSSSLERLEQAIARETRLMNTFHSTLLGKVIFHPVRSRCGPAIRGALGLVLFGLLASPASAAPLESNAFTYQGRLTARGLPVNGQFDLRLMLFDRPEATPAIQAGPTLTNASFHTEQSIVV